jgi:sulfur carrier protein
MLEVRINGENQQFPAAIRVSEMLTALKLEPKLLVIEYNGDILHRQEWEKTALQPGDRFEIVTVVGGG